MSARILVVDDTPLNVKLLSAKLARDYYIVSSAENGLDALKKIETEKPDIILLDVMMPEMDGFETCRRLKASPDTAHIPIIIVTALSDINDRVRGLAAGADDFLSKPIDDLALMARIRSLLRMKILMDEWRSREETALQLSPEGSEESAKFSSIKNSRILVISDDENDVKFIHEALTPLAAHIVDAKSITEAEPILNETSFDLVFSNLDMKQEDGLTVCPCLRSNTKTRHIPILLLADAHETARVAKGLDLGANDYLLRPFDSHELFARARTQLRHKRNYDRLRSGLEHNLMLALVDPLTGTFNRRYLDAHWPRFIGHAKNNKKPLSVMMFDIDFFKKVNDTYGHPSGDAVLREMAQRIFNSIRPSDFFVRMGGEEFAVVMPETERAHAEKIADRLREKIAQTPFSTSGTNQDLPITISAGVGTFFPHSLASPDDVFARADAALLRAKREGRNKVVVDTSQ